MKQKTVEVKLKQGLEARPGSNAGAGCKQACQQYLSGV